jgi:ligand-binding sensor domain-containing protein
MRALVMSETFTMRAALLFALLFCASVEASTDVTFWNSNINNRLNQIEVRFVAQDGSGALWFATQEGLTRYNGIRADSFSAANADLGGLQAGEVKALAKSPDGELWVLTNSIQRLDKASLLFQPTVDIGGTMQPTAIAFDTDGLLWIGLEGYVGLYRPSTKSFETI